MNDHPRDMGFPGVRTPEPLAPQALFHACDPDLLNLQTTTELADPDQVIGQDRALEALHFGIGMHHEGYNLYVLGSPGLGRRTLAPSCRKRNSRRLKPPSTSSRRSCHSTTPLPVARFPMQIHHGNDEERVL